eukprot:CFRG6358T1
MHGIFVQSTISKAILIQRVHYQTATSINRAGARVARASKSKYKTKEGTPVVPTKFPTVAEQANLGADKSGSLSANRAGRRAVLREAPVLPDVEARLYKLGLLRPRGTKQTKRAVKKAQRKSDEDEDNPVKELFSKKLVFKGTASTVKELPKLGLKEYAFVGRSNVGKSSLMNMLAGPHANPATVADKPGTTRSANFYALDKRMALVDLPGYGFAFADSESKEKWAELLTDYFKNRETLKRVFVLVDARHGIKVTDKEFLEFLDLHNVLYTVVMTKADLCPLKNLAKTVYLIEKALTEHEKASPKILPFSIHQPETVEALKKVLFNISRTSTDNTSAPKKPSKEIKSAV